MLYSLSPDEAQANYYRLKVIYFGKLKQRLDASMITQEFYDQQLNIFKGDLQNPDNILAQAGDFDFNKFLSDVSAYAGQTVAKAANLIADSAARIGVGVGKGFLSSLSIWSWLTIAGIGYYLYKYMRKKVAIAVILGSLSYSGLSQGNYINQLSPIQVNQVSNALYFPLLSAVSNAIIATGIFPTFDVNGDIWVTNNLHWKTNAWPGPTNKYDLAKGYQVYNSLTACSVTSFTNNGAGMYSQLYLKNISATNWVLTYPTTINTPDGVHASVTVTNGQFLYVGFDTTQETNVVAVHYY